MITTLTPDQINRINTLIAEKVMGWEKVYIDSPDNYYWKGEGAPTSYQRVAEGITTPDFCNDIAAAKQVQEKLLTDKAIRDFIIRHSKNRVKITLYHTQLGFVSAISDTEALSICLAALKAVGVDVREFEG